MKMKKIDYLAHALTALFVFDRLLKLTAIFHFFGKHSSLPATPQEEPSVSLIQPVTRGVQGLLHNLRSRARLDYAGSLQHLLICDAADIPTQAVCRAFLNEFPALNSRLILVAGDDNRPASKLEKMLAALPYATGEVLWFLDDDVALRPDAATVLLPYLRQSSVGAVFGLACYTNWSTLWSSLMSSFVNAQVLQSYIPLSYLTEPFTITGHCFALRREVFQNVGGFKHMERRIDDDHELARRIHRAGLHIVQTPLIYDVNNQLFSFKAYMQQMKRWFIFPRQAMLPFLNAREQWLSLLGSIANLFPPLLLLLALLTHQRSAITGVRMSLCLAATIYALCERRYLKRRTPLTGWLLLPITILITPLHILAILFSNNEIAWRGQRLRIKRGGKMEIVHEKDFSYHEYPDGSSHAN